MPDALVAQDVAHALRYFVVFARDDPRALLDDGDLRAEAPVHLAEFEPDVAAADDDQMLGQEVDVHHRRVGEIRSSCEARHRRHQRAAADVDEDLLRLAARRR